MDINLLIEKYINIKENIDLKSDQKTLMNSVNQFLTNNNKVSSSTKKSKGKYIEIVIKCKSKLAMDFVKEFKDFATKNGLLASPAPLISPTKEHRFYRSDQVLVMFLDYTDAGGASKSSSVKLYYPKSNK